MYTTKDSFSHRNRADNFAARSQDGLKSSGRLSRVARIINQTFFTSSPARLHERPPTDTRCGWRKNSQCPGERAAPTTRSSFFSSVLFRHVYQYARLMRRTDNFFCSALFRRADRSLRSIRALHRSFLILRPATTPSLSSFPAVLSFYRHRR